MKVKQCSDDSSGSSKTLAAWPVSYTHLLKKLVDWKSYGFEEVLTASGGSIARDLIEQKKPELLVTDIRMPRVSGLDLVKYIDEKNYPTKTIILSGYSEFEYAQQALRYGVTEYLVKPIPVSYTHLIWKSWRCEKTSSMK